MPRDVTAPKQARDDPPGGPSVFTGASPASENAKPDAAPPAPPGFEMLSDALALQAAGSQGRPTIFPQLKWAAVEKANTLAKVKTLPVSSPSLIKTTKNHV